jgi:hypothetical protein
MIAEKNRQRVSKNTREEYDHQIRRETEKNIAYYATRPGEIPQRLRELDEEWDIERALMMNAAAITLFSVMRSIMGRRRYTLVSLIVPGFLLQHAVQGWCPPLNIFRRLGFRTQMEIDLERYALKALRGDFEDLPTDKGKERFEGVAELMDKMK